MTHSEIQPFKVEKILKGRLDLIPSPSPSVKIEIMGKKIQSTFLKLFYFTKIYTNFAEIQNLCFEISEQYV